MSLVLDSSATLAWIFGDETTESIRTVFEQVIERGAFVPTLWRLEVANAFQSGIRRKRIDKAYRDASIADLGKLPILIDADTDGHIWTTTLWLSDRYGLTIYDACYLELAQRRNLPLATLDQELRAAGHALGLALLGG